MPKSIFLSYAGTADESFVRRLYQDLLAAGLRVWFDREEIPNRDLAITLEVGDAIKAADCVLLVIGPDTANVL
jgi:hypothetical protein